MSIIKTVGAMVLTLVVAGGVVGVGACGGGAGSTSNSGGTSGNGGNGGAPATGGVSAMGGATSAGGAGGATGGASGGGTSAGGKGGKSALGGASATGGRAAMGGQSTAGGRGGNSSGGRGGGGGGMGGGLPACVLMDDTQAPFVAYQRTSDPAPEPAGGIIATGTYFLTNLTYHGGMQVSTPCVTSLVHEVLRVTATSDTEGTMHSSLVFRYEDGSGRSQHPGQHTYQISGSSYTGRSTCTSSGSTSEKFTATDQQILVTRGPFDASCDTGVTLVMTYDKQP